jgi:hypothetical protein
MLARAHAGIKGLVACRCLIASCDPSERHSQYLKLLETIASFFDVMWRWASPQDSLLFRGGVACESSLGADLPGKKCGEAGIRTLGTLLGYNALAKRRFRPLSHLTKHESPEYSGRGRTSN